MPSNVHSPFLYLAVRESEAGDGPLGKAGVTPATPVSNPRGPAPDTPKLGVWLLEKSTGSVCSLVGAKGGGPEES